MAEAYLAEIRMFGFNFPPRKWLNCDGQILPINQYQSLYSLLGTTYGGDGRTTFGLPDLRGRIALHEGSGYNLGAKSGGETETLTVAQMPNHNHVAVATNDNTGIVNTMLNDVLAQAPAGSNPYAAFNGNVSMKTGMIGNEGGGQGHDNMSPYQVIAFCICVQGLLPSRN